MNFRSLRFRMTAWYAGLLVGALLVFGVSVYLGLERYLDWTLQGMLASEGRTIGTELLSQLPGKEAHWLETEINEAYAPEVNARFIRVYREGTGVIYLSGAPKDGTFDPTRIPFPPAEKKDGVRRTRLASGQPLLIVTMSFTTPDGSRFMVESGMPDQQIQVVLHGLLLTLAIYTPFIVFLAIGGGYWLMRRSLQPVDEITARAEGITSSNLSERLPVIRTGDELERLSNALNRMIARLEDAFQHINRFSADASHELRTPLTILQLELEGIVHNHRLSESLEDQIGSALEETHRMYRIVESLLTISRLDAGDAKLDLLHLDLSALATSTGAEMRVLAQEKAITLRTTTEDSVYVEGDRTRLQQVVANLIDNAIKYTQECGTVEVSVHSESGKAVLQVSDNGGGIPAEAVPHVFERFYRVDKARSRASGGAGLGLSIAKAICAAHGAEISVSSQEGRGSCFRVEFPLVPAVENRDPNELRKVSF
ncbi:MAG TPA: ATP-binding protein [Candidatus Sulfotelmatobacter sp.]|nr:ATP-binding protein [Candidatus Sulfotelmatobacter sp.]